jgi:hypothetical protein
MCLLLFGGVDTIRVGPSADGYTLDIRSYIGEDSICRGVYKRDGESIVIQLPREQIELWVWFPLQHLHSDIVSQTRGYADHVDVEMDPVDSNSAILDLVMEIVGPLA